MTLYQLMDKIKEVFGSEEAAEEWLYRYSAHLGSDPLYLIATADRNNGNLGTVARYVSQMEHGTYV